MRQKIFADIKIKMFSLTLNKETNEMSRDEISI
jgi:hypothetical protein